MTFIMNIILIKLDKLIFKTFSTIAINFLVCLFLLMAMNVILRFFPIISIGWFDEIIELLFSWMIFCEAAVLWKLKEHPYIDLIENKIKNDVIKYKLFTLIELINISFLAFFVYYSCTLINNASAWSPIFKISKKIYYLSMPLSGLYMIACSLLFIYHHMDKIKKAKYEQRINDIESQYKIRS